MRLANTVLIYKKGDKNDINNYRPISLVNVDAKIFSLILCNRLHGRIKKVVMPEQQGFIGGKNIVDPILNLDTTIKKMDKTNRVLLVDYEKAFDKVTHEAVIEAFRLAFTGSDAWKMIESWIKGNKSRLCVNGKLSGEVPLMQTPPETVSCFCFVLDKSSAFRNMTRNGVRFETVICFSHPYTTFKHPILVSMF